MKKEVLFKKIKEILLHNSEIEFAYVFGSYAVDKETELSDIDIAIYQKNNGNSYSLRKNEFIIESDLIQKLPGYEFDVRSLNDAPIVISGKIINEGMLLFNRDENFYYDYIVNTRLKYMDYLIVYTPLFDYRYNNLLNDR